MSTKKLTSKTSSNAKPSAKPYEVRDTAKGSVRGLLLRVQPSGVKTYYYEYSRGKRVKIGPGAITLTRARELAKNVAADVSKGIDPRRRLSAPITLGKFIDEVYAPHFRLHHRTDASLANLTVFKPMHNKRLQDLTAKQFKQWRSQRLAAGRNPATINRNVSGLKTALNYAVEEGYLETNPLDGIGSLKIEHPNRVRYLTEPEEKALRAALNAREGRIRSERLTANEWRKARGYDLYPDLSNLPFADHLKPMVVLTMNTGLRRGELFALRWNDVVEDVLTVKRSKSGKARHIPLNTEASATLEGWRSFGTKKWVFENNGKPFDNVNKAWANVLNDAGIEDFRWHDLRHHFASKLVMSNIALNTVRDLLGHSDIKMTTRYAHLAPGHMREAVEAISG